MFRRKRNAGDFNSEIEAHIRLEAERLREQGLGEEDARAAARRAFGNVTQAQERFFESGRWLSWDYFWQDLRFAIRLLRCLRSARCPSILPSCCGRSERVLLGGRNSF